MSIQTPPDRKPDRREVSLDDRYTAESGPVMLGGIQALVRLMLDQRRLDERRGHQTGIYVSGYQGSPLGGLDQELGRAQRWLGPADVVFHAGLNEELAATAVAGTQLLTQLAGATKEGVTGFWYGKNPGLERAADAIRHGNVSGTAPLGGAVALIGDDPTSKSSTVPSACESMCRTLTMPLLAPGTIEELVQLGLHAVAISRHAGVWAGVKIVSDLADCAGVIQAGVALDAIPDLPLREDRGPVVMLPPHNLELEHDLFTTRLARVHEYARMTRLNRVIFEPRRPRMGIVASGMAYQSLVSALATLGISHDDLEAIGIRLVRISMPWPLAEDELRQLVGGLYTVLVIEDKMPFVEAQIKESLYHESGAPLVFGKHDHEGKPLLPINGSVTADDVAAAIVRVLPADWVPQTVSERMQDFMQLAEGASTLAPIDAAAELPMTKRTPYFCSGCPHNVSTRADSEQLVGIGIGCHTMVVLDHDDRRGHLLGTPQMGGEGAQWFGLSSFVTEPHFIQNMGDGTYHHSGSLAIRAAVAAGVNITYRLLYNDAVAMTGGQTPEGRLSVPDLARELALEGVSRIVVTTPEPERYHGVTLAPIASVRSRDDYDAVQAELAATPGVTVLIHDDRCATEKRRLRKRGQLPVPAEHVWINERVCEGCGDCGEKSSCLSVLPVQTEFGRKTQIQQSSCNQDMTCLKGDCPSFVVVKHDRAHDEAGAESLSTRTRPLPTPPVDLPEPERRVTDDVVVRMPGVGGTGVVTAAAILRMAAFLQGRHAAGVDQTGLAQKGGPVQSDLRISSEPIVGQIRASRGGVDVLLGFDLLGCVDPNTLATLSPERTVAVMNIDVTPTAANVTDVNVPLPVSARLIARVRHATRAQDAVAIAAQTISESLFGDHMQSNLVLIGAAYQHGCLPLEADAIERAIELNGAAVERNLAAFRWGRAAIADPGALDHALGRDIESRPTAAPQNLSELVGRLSAELSEYQNERYSHTYISEVASVSEALRTQLADDSQFDAIATAYARGLFKLMAYKDEYEVARLHLDTVEGARLQSEFGSRAQVKVLLHPPMLRSLGMKRKIRLGASAMPLFTVLRAGRRLRGTALDPFGRSEVRRLERALVGEYRELMHTAIQQLTPSTAATVLEVAQLPDLVRGYEQIKLAGVERMRERAIGLMQQLTDPDADLEEEGASLAEAAMAGYPLEVHRVQDSTSSNPSRR